MLFRSRAGTLPDDAPEAAGTAFVDLPEAQAKGPDEPEWLSHVNANVLKVKLATAIIGISSIHLLKTFINAQNMDEKTMLWQVVIHVTFLLSAVSIAWIDRLMSPGTLAHMKRE